MSKSLGNFYTLRDLLDKKLSGREIRYTLLGCHYRQPLNFTLQSCRDARSALQRLDDFVARLHDTAQEETEGQEEIPPCPALDRAHNEFRRALEDDLNIAEALAALFLLVRDFNRLLDIGKATAVHAGKALALMRQFDTVLGVLDVDRDEQQVPASIEALAEERQQARKDKDFARADAIRDQLAEKGWIIEDTPSGSRLKRK